MRHVIRYPQLMRPALCASRRGWCRSAWRSLHPRNVIIRNLILTRNRSMLLAPFSTAFEHFVSKVVSHGRLAVRTDVRILQHLHVIALLIGLQPLYLLVLG